jgi:putative inorganic carbon (HCO3(-)) transporter
LPLSADLNRWAWPLLIAAAASVVGLLAGYDPRFAIVAALVIAFVLIAFLDLSLGVTCFAVLAAADLVPTSSPLLSVTKVAGLLLAISWIALVTTREGQQDFAHAYPAIAMVLVAFVGWALLSATWAEDPSRSISAAGRFALNIVLFLIVFTAIRTPRQARMVGGGYVLGAVIAAVYGMVVAPDPSAEGRLSGAGGLDPNELAAVLVPGVILALGLAASYRGNPPARWLALAAAAFCTAGICLTASRGGLIALAVALIATVVLARGWRAQALVAALAIGVTAFFYFASFASTDTRQRIESVTQGQERILEGRTTIWQVGQRTFEDNVVTGVGGGNFGVAARHYLLEPGALGRSDQIIQETPAAHNAFLEVGAELGVVGLAMLLGVMVFCIAAAVRAARLFKGAGNRSMAIFSTACAVGIVGTLAADFFISEQHSKQLWLLLGLAPALLTIARAAEPRSHPQRDA